MGKTYKKLINLKQIEASYSQKNKNKNKELIPEREKTVEGKNEFYNFNM